MIHDISETRAQEQSRETRAKDGDKSFQVALWSVWTLIVVGFALFEWQAQLASERGVSVVGLIIHTLLVGLVGLVIITWAELRLDPRRFSE